MGVPPNHRKMDDHNLVFVSTMVRNRGTSMTSETAMKWDPYLNEMINTIDYHVQ